MSKKLFGKFFIFLLVVGLLFAVAPTGQAQAATICVNPGGTDGCFASIQAAINAAGTGDTITVAAGSYNENVVIDEQVTLTGAGRDVTTVTAGNTIKPVFRVTADGVTISGFTLTGASGHQEEPFQDGDGINLDGADNCVVTDNAFIANRQGAYVTGSYNAFQRNIISNNISNGVILIADEDEPTHLGDNNTFDGNTIADNIKYGLNISSSNNTFINNTITGNDGCGVALFGGTSGNTINFNAISGNTGAGGVYSIASYTNDATKNWWGTATGPIHSTNPGATGNKVTNVDYSPWLGFVPGTTPMDWYLNTTGTIQDGIDAAANGETIHVLAGTYVEDVVVADKYFNLIGAVDTNGDPISILEGSLFIDNPGYYSPEKPEYSNIKNMYFERTDSHLLNLTNFNGGLIENCVFDGNNGFLDYQFNGINLVSGPNGNSNITVLDSTFKDGLYVGIGGYADGLTVQTSEFTNVKSGINLQGGGGNLVVTDSTFLTKPVSDGDSYGIRFASASGATPNLTVTGSTFNIDDSLGFDPASGDYHAALYIRAGATGSLELDKNQILGDVVQLSTTSLDASPNWWGSAAGPTAAQIVGIADYIPWCGEAECTTLVYPPVHNVTQDTWHGTIQAAIDAAVDGNLIEVAPGTYNEKVTLNKPNITVRSTDGAATTIIDVPLGTLTRGVWVEANMGVLTFDGFTVKNFTEGGIIQGMAARTGTKIHVLNNIILPYDPPEGEPYLRNGIQVTGDGSTVKGNYVEGAYLTPDWGSTGILVVNASNVVIENNTISGELYGLDMGIGVLNYNVATVDNIQILNNVITGVDYSLDVTANSGTISGVVIEYNEITDYIEPIWAGLNGGTSVAQVDASPNWWGSEFGPQGVVTGDVDVIQWCADEECTTFAPEGGLITLTSADSQIGAIKIYVPGISYYLTPGTVLQNSSPCFEVYANDVMIYTDYPAAAACVPTNGSDGIWVADGVENLRVINLEFDGTGQTTGSGIFFAGDVVGFQVVDNYFHNLGGSGVVFTGTPSGSTMDIQGNMFQDLGAAAIVSPAAINAEYNSWGVYAGATLTNVDTEPHTHADFYMEYEGVIPLEKVAVGNTIKYTVYGNLQNISGADFTLKFPTAYLDAATPTNLSAFTSAGPAMFIVDDVAGTIRFQGDASMAPITGENLPIFEVVFTGTAAGTGAISFDLTNDVFSMSPGYGPSTWVYAAGYVDRTVEVFVDSAAPTLTSWTPDEGDIYLAEGEDFVLTVDALDDNLFSLEIDHNVTTLPEFTVYASATNVYGSTAAQNAFEAAGLIVTYDESTQTWTLTFNSAGSALAALLAKQDVVFYAVLHDQAGKTWGSMDPTEDFNTFEYSIVFDNTAPTLDSWSPIKDMTYMLTPSGDFVVTVDANDVNLYELEIDNSLEPGLPQFSVYADQADPYGGDGTQFEAAGVEVTYDPLTQTWVLTFENGGFALDTIIANQGITFYAVIYDMAGNTWGSMYTVTPDNTFAYTLYQQQPIARADSTGGDVVAVVSADGNTIDFTGEVDWYPADPDLGRTSGHRIGVKLSAPELDFVTSDTTFTFNGQTYDWDLVKDGDDYVLVYPKVTAEIQTWEIVVTWGGDFSQTFMVNFNGTLGPVTAYTVDGEISMQGRVARNTEDVITLDGYELDDFTADSLDKLGINYTLSDVLTGEYTIVTNQPRYLNIYCNEDSTDAIPDFCKKITLISDRTLPTLWLRGGNAIWTDNEITLDDANKVGTDWGSDLNPDGNVNFDSIVNIQDLALVGGNYGLTSADAYGTWLP